MQVDADFVTDRELTARYKDTRVFLRLDTNFERNPLQHLGHIMRVGE